MEPAFAASSHAEELEFMLRLLREAGRILLNGRITGHEVRYKSDNSIVTSIDHECALYMDAEIEARFPGDAILNEETSHLGTTPWHEAERCWILDPLDSTSSYVRGGQHYGVIIALAVGGVPTVGMTYKPELGEVYFAVKGEGANRTFTGSEPGLVQSIPVKVSNESKHHLIVSRGRQSPALQDLIKKLGFPQHHRMNGSLKINEVARGEYTAFVSPPENPMCLWDLAAPQVILEEAGGRMTDLKGQPLDYRSVDPVLRKGLVASNGVVHQGILDKAGR